MLNKCLPSSSGLRHIIYKTNKQKNLLVPQFPYTTLRDG